jgi:ATP-dependent exoDNAse (exonuclease V) beta subunit
MLDKLDYFRDPNFVFDPIEHSYTYLNPETGKPIQIFESVSGFISQFKKPFDAQQISKYVAKARQQTQEEVLAEWDLAKVKGLTLGSTVHDWIEDFYDNKNPPLPELNEACKRIDMFKDTIANKLANFKPVEQEFRMFSREWGIAGTLDILFSLHDKKFYVGDWKTNKKFTRDSDKDGRRQKMLYPFTDLYDNSLNGYSIQVSTYRLMLEEAGFETDGGFIVWLGPDGCEMYKTLDLRDRIKKFLKQNNFGL